jgi:hypothetical protein
LFLSVSIAGFFAYQTQNLVKELTSLKSSSSPVPSTEPTPDPTADWKTYTNEKFSFKYPVRLTEDKNGLVGGTFLGNPKMVVSFEDQLTVRDGTDAPPDGFSIYQISNTEGSLENFIRKEVSTRKGSPRGILSEEIKTIMVDGKQAYYIDAEQNIRQYFMSNTDNSNIVLSSVRQDDSFILELDQIISTFKFTNINNELTKKTAYIRSIIPNGDNYKITVDFVSLIPDKNKPNGYVISNPDSETTTLLTDVPGSEPEVVMQTLSRKSDGDYNYGEKITFSRFLEAFNSNSFSKDSVYTIESFGKTAIKITEYFLP